MPHKLTQDAECAITLEKLSDIEFPTVTQCGHLFSDPDLQDWIETNDSAPCPCCKTEITSTSFYPLLTDNLLSEQQKINWLNACLMVENDEGLLRLIQAGTKIPMKHDELMGYFLEALRARRMHFIEAMFELARDQRDMLIFVLIDQKAYGVAIQMLEKFTFPNLAMYQFSNGDTVLHKAIRAKETALVYALLKHNHPATIANDDSITADKLSKDEGTPDIQFLVSNAWRPFFNHVRDGKLTSLMAAFRCIVLPEFMKEELLVDAMKQGASRAVAVILQSGVDCSSRRIYDVAQSYGYHAFLHYLNKSYPKQTDDSDKALQLGGFEDRFYLAYIRDLAHHGLQSTDHWSKQLNFTARDVYKHARGDNQFLLYHRGTRTKEALFGLGLLSKSGTPTEATPQAYRPYCRPCR